MWYAYSARRKSERAFSLIDFRTSVRLNYLDLRDNGQPTLEWLQRQADKRLHALEVHNRDWTHEVRHFGEQIAEYGVTPYNVYYFMQGHTLLDNVIITLLHAVCDKLRDITTQRINMGTKQGVALKTRSATTTTLCGTYARYCSTTSITRTASFTTNCKTISSATSPR